MNMLKHKSWFMLLLLCGSGTAMAGGGGSTELLNLKMTNSLNGLIAIFVFLIAYFFVMVEEFTHLRKSKPVIVSAGIIWIIVALCAKAIGADVQEQALYTVRHNILEFAELFLFLLVAMTYINTLEERNVFDTLRCWLVSKGFNFRSIFWITGVLAFFISPVADNLTTALLMCAVVMAVAPNNPKFVGLACINIVVAANAGGAFSPFGDITTLMVWQKGILPFQDFFYIFVPSVVSYVIPAFFMSLAIEDGTPAVSTEKVAMKFGAKRVMALFLFTIATAVTFHNYLHMPPALGMMTGLGLLKIFGFFIKQNDRRNREISDLEKDEFDIFRKLANAEWDTLMFFFGLILSVGGLASLGYLSAASTFLYQDLGAELSAMHQATPANIAVGILSAIVDNIPVMFAVLTMNPDMSEGQWLLVTLTAGIGGSMLSIGSAAGVALMGKARGYYTFFGHLRWTWAIMLGYFAAIYVHILINERLFLVE